MLDFVLNFFMAYEDRDKKVETRLRYIAVNYIKTWFMLDFISCIPFQYLEPEQTQTATIVMPDDSQEGDTTQGQYTTVQRIPKIYRLLRILRLMKLIRLVKYNRSISKIL
jgi:hypothetical protein